MIEPSEISSLIHELEQFLENLFTSGSGNQSAISKWKKKSEIR